MGNTINKLESIKVILPFVKYTQTTVHSSEIYNGSRLQMNIIVKKFTILEVSNDRN